jgi:fluoroacetyl-CoA thioesterase
MKMELSSLIHLGMQREETFAVEDSHSAMHVGSGASRVLATPWMIAFMERNAHRLLAEKLPDGYSSVGVLVNVRHLAPTPVGSRLRVMARVIGIDGLKVTFNVEAWDQQEQVGEGMHERFVIETQRFLQRVETKMKLMEKS